MLVPLAFPPGLYRQGTEYQSKDRFYDANLWRWAKGKSGPVGGWEELGAGVSGTVRGAHSWVDLSGVSHLALASTDSLWSVSASGTVTEITPLAIATSPAGSVWSLDNAGQQLFAVNDDEGQVWSWVPGDVTAAALTNAPTCSALVVTDERILMVFGSGGDPRLIRWSDSEAFTVWTETTTNLTRSFPLQTSGELRCGRTIRGGVLVLTSEDAWIARFLGRPFVYGFDPIGKDCGIVSRKAVAVIDDMAYWMGRDRFHVSSGGGVSELPCTIHDDVFGSAEEPTRGLNRTYQHLCHAVHVAAHSEVWFFYPKGSATEISHAAIYNYAEGHWSMAALVRLCGVGRGSGFGYPMMIGSGGEIWQHEKGETRTGAGTIYAKSGPMELGSGEQMMYGSMIFPDEGTAGDVQTYIRTRPYPNASETTYGPFTSANPMGCNFTGRQAAIEHRLVDTDDGGRVGTFRVKVVPGGLM